MRSKYSRVMIRNRIQPDSVFVKLKDYAYIRDSDITIVPGAFPVFFTYLMGNGLHDPFDVNYQSQPTGLDQWGTFYHRYVVHGSKIRLTAVQYAYQAEGVPENIDGSITQAGFVSLFPTHTTADVTVGGSLINVVEQPYSKTRITLPGANPLASFTSAFGGNNKAIINSFMRTKHMSPAGDLLDKDELTAYTDPDIGTNGGNPEDPWYWLAVFHGTVASDGNEQSALFYSFFIEITYYVQFFDRKNVADVTPVPPAARMADKYRGFRIIDRHAEKMKARGIKVEPPNELELVSQLAEKYNNH